MAKGAGRQGLCPIYYDKRAYCFHAYIDFNPMHVRYLTSLQGSRITVLHDEISHNGLGVKVIVMALFGVRGLSRVRLWL